MKIAFLINGALPLKTINTTLRKFPNAYLYVLNSSFDVLEKSHEGLLEQAGSIGVQKYSLLSKLCYFNDLRRQEECQGVLQQNGGAITVVKSSPQVEQQLHEIIKQAL